MNRVCSIFSQWWQFFPRTELEGAVRQPKAERHARGFSSWTQFMAMLFCHLGRAQSLREICGGLAACEGKLRHLGVQPPPRKSTLAYANEHRPWELYRTIVEQLLGKCQAVAPGSVVPDSFCCGKSSMIAGPVRLSLFDYQTDSVPSATFVR